LASEARQHVVELRKLDLQLAFAAARVAGKDVENELRPINHAAFGVFFDVALLHRRKIAVEDDQRRLLGMGFGADFIQLAASDQRGRVGNVAKLKNCSGYGSAGTAGELDKFSEGFALRLTSGYPWDAPGSLPSYADQQSAFGGRYGLRGLHRGEGL